MVRPQAYQAVLTKTSKDWPELGPRAGLEMHGIMCSIWFLHSCRLFSLLLTLSVECIFDIPVREGVEQASQNCSFVEATSLTLSKILKLQAKS